VELLESLLYVFVDMEIQPAGHSTRPLHPSAVVALALGWPGHTAVDQVLCRRCASAYLTRRAYSSGLFELSFS
jgi:hypothetical protein